MRRASTLTALAAVVALAAALAACSGDGSRSAAPSDAASGGTAVGPDPETEREPAQAEEQARFRLVRVASGLSSPVHLAAAPGEPGRLYVVEQAGRIRVIQAGRVLSRPFLDIRSIVASGGERGLLSVAFHPRYASNRLFYVDYTDVEGDTRVVEYRARAGGQPVRVRQLLFVDQPYANHNGGQLAFGPDGNLYVGMGDGGSGGDPENRAQNLGSTLGKLLRRNVGATSSSWQVVGYGLRNPWRFSFDRRTGDLYIGDVGQNDWEEIDFTPRSSPGLENYGWDVFEGTHRFEDKSPNSAGRLVAPVVEYNHDLGCSVTGGFVYRGSAVPAARGRYFYGDYCSGTIWSFVMQNGRATDRRRHSFRVGALSSFGEGPGGELYVVSQEGLIFRLARG
jgi:glucose/arabinose dehydrogenase